MVINNEGTKSLKQVSIIGISFLFFLVEILLLIMLSKNDDILNFRSLFWILHLALSIIFIFVYKRFFQESIGYYDIFIIIFPVVGIFLFFMDEIFSIWKVKKAIAEEVLGNNEVEEILQKLKKDYMVSEFDVMSSYDLLSSSNNDNKKKFLFSFESKDPKLKVEMLQRALQDENTEVIHYAATEVNKLDAGIQEKINNIEKEKIKETDKEEIKKLDYKIFKLYKSYVDSGLLFGEILNFYQNKTLEILKNLQISEKEREFFLIELYENMSNESDYENLLKDRISKYSESEIITKYLKFLYRQNRFEELINEYRKYEKMGNSQIEKPVFLEEILL
ncbi:hypothetical protein JMUB4039_1785 [Leptotrichia trevisanii]|uniref:hypothetical protein n=1 Tax=Leptotrichia trevisanii TaxID=109328 RepID=UPI0011878D24|nr:hypothetical protein [Leptotrichia trevisanii]BBM57805.1 hypothetical protein JMUB4039_1785 [Leptotrichia trevisanii]